MSSAPTFPLDIHETIIDILAEDGDQSALKTYSLVCQAFLSTCRKHIFASIVLNNAEAPYCTTSALERLLSERPEIANYIRKLDYNFRLEDFTDPSIQESWKRISALESLTVRRLYNGPRLDWSNNPLRSALLRLLHLSTLTHFELFAVNDFVVSDLIPCVNLKHLRIDFYTTVANETTFVAGLSLYPIQPNEFVGGVGTATAITKLCTARRLDGQLVVDFRPLSKITLGIQQHDECKAAQELFKHCEKLADVDISFWDAGYVITSLADMLRPSMQTLKHIAVMVYVDGVYFDPLFGIPSELEAMRTGNIVESIAIRVTVQMGGDCDRGDDWGRLDEVLTKSGWCALKRVSLAIEINRLAGNHDELEGVLRRLPETQFPRLSMSQSIAFDFAVNSV